jgi:LmbE family N-acetylglucosaminyl deacetylase
VSRSVVVAAHPDDEILWLSAALADARPVVLCFGAPFGRPEKATARRRAVAELGLPHLADLALPESGVRKLVDWSQPELTPTGMSIADASGQARYDTNFMRLLADLRPLLAGASDVYTHNPWGEYGHPEHVQVYRAVTVLQAEQPFTLWFSNYVGPSSWGLAQRLGAAPCWVEKRIVQPDLILAKRLRRIYRRHGVWTWSRLHRWPAQETLYAQPGRDDRGTWHSLRGETLLDVSALRWWRGREAALRPLP